MFFRLSKEVKCKMLTNEYIRISYLLFDLPTKKREEKGKNFCCSFTFDKINTNEIKVEQR